MRAHVSRLRFGLVARIERDRRPPFVAAHDVLNCHDPERLLEAGLPDDEYDAEVEEIAGRIRSGVPITSKWLVEFWEHRFGPDSGYVTRATGHEVATLAAELNALR